MPYKFLHNFIYFILWKYMKIQYEKQSLWSNTNSIQQSLSLAKADPSIAWARLRYLLWKQKGHEHHTLTSRPPTAKGLFYWKNLQNFKHLLMFWHFLFSNLFYKYQYQTSLLATLYRVIKRKCQKFESLDTLFTFHYNISSSNMSKSIAL